VADYTPAAPSLRKLKKGNTPLALELKPTEDILATVAAMADGPFCVGFAAESENLAEYAQAKRAKKRIPMIVANLVQQAVGRDDNEVTIYDDHGAHPLARAPKSRIAQQIVEHALALEQAARAGKAVVAPLQHAR
jgi:phosphopantothenoylcysteine decarboxylase/phosphopantothenate--cysteine ligase